LEPERKPGWLKMPTIGNGTAGEVRRLLRSMSINTVCSEARCPNRGHCYQRGTATFLILGSVCTRNCAYCAIERNVAAPPLPDPEEPEKVARASELMKLRYIVITSVTRDDLPDGGAGHFADSINSVRRRIPDAGIEVLTPDFSGNRGSLRIIAEAGPDVFNHNIETVERLFPSLRPVASYRQSLAVLKNYAELAPDTPRKSGIMMGLGETDGDIESAFQDLRDSGVGLLTIGQYLQPTSGHIPPHRYVTPDEFNRLKELAISMGFNGVASGAMVRSSYHADLLRGDA